MKYDAVIFDLFGTLIDNFTDREFTRVISEIAEAVSAPRDEFMRLWKDTAGDRMAGRHETVVSSIQASNQV